MWGPAPTGRGGRGGEVRRQPPQQLRQLSAHCTPHAGCNQVVIASLTEGGAWASRAQGADTCTHGSSLWRKASTHLQHLTSTCMCAPRLFVCVCVQVWAMVAQASGVMKSATGGNLCNMDILAWWVWPDMTHQGA